VDNEIINKINRLKEHKIKSLKMNKIFKAWNSETTIKTERLYEKHSKWSTFVILVIAVFMLNACKKAEADATLRTSSSVSKYYVHNGESVTLTMELLEGEVDQVSFFWNSIRLQTLTSPPYEVTYKVENESIGIHSFSYTATCSRSDSGFGSAAAAATATSGTHAIIVEE